MTGSFYQLKLLFKRKKYLDGNMYSFKADSIRKEKTKEIEVYLNCLIVFFYK
jgi:hypothetical protein